MASFSTQKACTSLSSSSSSSISQWKHDVFLSFYGEDTRKNFTDHLYAALIRKGINVYRDNENLKEGKPIATELMKAIEESKYAIIVLSKNYAFSKWCLNELVKILECMKEKGLKVRPIFYHVYPSDVGNQRETFEKAFLKHEEDGKVSIKQMQEWRTALKEVSKLRGRHLSDSPESVDIEEITERIFDELNHELSDDFEHLVGIKSHVKEMMNLVSTMSDDVHFIGIWGMPGIGKTTLASVIYNRICHQFEASSFIHDIRETDEKDKQGLVNLQKQLLSETLMVKEVNIRNHHEGIKVIKQRLLNKKVLIVLDDVDKDEQLKALAGSPNWFGLGSMIIITSKDKHLLKRHHLGTTIYKVNGLDNDEALELFSWTVFKQTYPKKGFEGLSNGFVKYAKGLPIALKVLGSSLIDKPGTVWEDYLHQLEEIPEDKILDKLEISYRGLNEREQNLFLDIACFFKGEDKNRVAHIEGIGCKMNIETLKDKSLIAILGGKLRMHDLIQEMGWRIVRRESPYVPGRRSRLWFCKDVFHVLKENTGTEVVEGIVLDFQGTEVVEGMVLNSPPRKENLNDKAFLYMKSLRLLKISNVHLPTGLNFLSNKLRMMEWHDYPLKFMPISFQPDNLVELIMPRSHIEELPEGLTNLAKLRLLDLSDSKVLVKTPNFIGCPNLERLIFQGCTSLYELHPSVGALNKLTLLNLKDCRSLTGLPCEINLKSLKIFILSGCSSLKKFSEIGTNMTSLSELYLDGIAVEELPSSLERLTGMTVLSLQGCKNLSSFPSVNLPSLKTLNLSGFKYQPPKSCLSHGFSLVRAAHAFFQGCFPIQEAINLLLPRLRFIVSLNLADRNLWDGGLPDDLSGISSLQELDLSKNNFTRLPDSISQLSKLKYLTLNDCNGLQSLPDLPLSVGSVIARRCPLLEKYSNRYGVWTSGETGFTVVNFECKDDSEITPIRIPSLPYDDFDPFWERFMEDIIHQNKNLCIISDSTEIPEWFSRLSLGSSITIPLPSNLHDKDNGWIGIALFAAVEIDKNLNNVSSSQDYKVFIHFIYGSDMVEGFGHCLLGLKISEVQYEPSSRSASFGFKILIPAQKLIDHIEECSRLTTLITTSDCRYVEIKMCSARVLYKQDLVKFMQASGKRKQRSKCNRDDKVECSRLCQDIIHEEINFCEFSHSTEIPEWFSHQNLGSSESLDLHVHDNSNWIGIALFAVVVVDKNLNRQNYKVFIKFNCRSDMVEGPVDRRPLVHEISQLMPKPVRHSSSFSFKVLVQAGQLREHLKKCSWISTLITSDSPNYVKIKKFGARVVCEQDVEKFVQASGRIKRRSQCQMDKVESSQSNGRLKGKLMSLLSRAYQGDLARNHKYDYVFPQMKVPDWFSNQSFSSDIRIKLPARLQLDGRWMGIAVCACYTVHKQPAISGDNKDLTSFLNFYNPLVSHRVCLTRHRVFQESKDIFLEPYDRILVFYIPHVLLRLEECQHIGASFEHNKPDVQVKECGLRLVYEQDVENFVQMLVQCMLESPDAYHERFYKNLLSQVEEREAGKDFGFSSSLQRMPQPMPILQRSFENIAEGCTSSETSPSSFTGFVVRARKEQYASIMSSESLIKARLEKNFDEGEIFHCCFAEREMPPWFCCENKQSMNIPLAPEFVNDPDWMGFALCGLFSFNRHPTAVRQSLDSKKNEAFQFRCLLATSSCFRRLVCYGLLTTDNEEVSLKQRAFIWVMFIPRTTHAHLWSQSPWAQFWLESSIPDLSPESFGFRLVFRHNMDELTQELKRCSVSAPFDSLLDSCDPRLFYKIWEILPEVFIGTKNSYEDLHPQRLFISQEETGATAQYSYEYFYPHNHFRCFHPSTLYNSCFPTRRTPRWFNHHCRLGHSVTIEIPPNLYEDNNWLGLTLYASIFIRREHASIFFPREQENVVSANSSHFLYCQFQTSKAGLDNQILVCRTTDEEGNWFNQLFGLIWISYIPGEALKDMLHQCGHIKASFVSDWPSVTVQKCGLRLLYQHDRLQFEQQLEHCNVFISAQRDFGCQLSHHGTMLERMEECMQVADKVRSLLNKYDQLFVGDFKYSYCFPPVEISRYFNHESNEPSVKIDLSNVFFDDSKWMGLVLYAYFSSDEHQTAIIENPNASISHHLICLLETDLAVLAIHFHRTIKVEFSWLDIEGGFLWLCYIPCWQFLDRLNQCSCIKASIISDWPGIIVKKCGLSFYHVHDNWFQEITDHCNMQFLYQDFYDQLTASYIAKTSRAKNQLSESHLPGFDRSCDYNSCCPPIEIPHWFDIQSDESHVTFSLTRKLNNRSTWMGVALCAVFSIDKFVANPNDVMDSKSSYKLICHLEASNGLSVKPRHIYWPTKEDLMMSLLGEFTWLTYIPRGSFPDWLCDCAFIKFSFKTNCLGLKVQKCGLHVLEYHNSVEKFINCMNSNSDISAILNQKKIENRNRKMMSLIRNGLSKNGTLDFDQCIFYNPRLPSSEILEWFNHRSDEPWLRIPLPPNLDDDNTWMGLVLCAYFAIDVNPTAHFDILDSDTSPGLICYLETNVGGVRPLLGYDLTKEDLVMLQHGGCILLSYRGRNCLNQVNWIKASFVTDCPVLKVEKCGLRLLYHYELEEFEQMNSPSDDLEEFAQTIRHSMNSTSDDWDFIHHLPTDDGNRDKQKLDGEGTSSRTSSSRKESNFGSLRRPIDPKDKGKRVLEE